jgi:GntR family transcriptional repressor for pyruvate dehydrogenase complex
MTPITRPKRLTDEVATAIASRIQSGSLHPGEQLPAERQLADSLGVSRPVIREALAQLKLDGFIESRQGVGVFVTPTPGHASFRLDRGNGAAADDLKQIFELRQMVEVAASELAAIRRTERDLRAMRSAFSRMEQCVRDGTDGAQADDEFHCTIAAATHNPYVGRFVQFLGQAFTSSRRPTWSDAGHAQGKAVMAQREHRRLLDAIAAGDPRAARAAAVPHLRNSIGRIGIAEATTPKRRHNGPANGS